MRSFAVVLFSVVIPTFNNQAELRRCLEALCRQTCADMEVLVCVDGSKDGTLEWLSTWKAPFPMKVLCHDDAANHGRAAARNLALPHLAGDFTLFLDSDMALLPDALAAHADLLRSPQSISIGTVHYLNAMNNPWARYTAERGVGKFRHGELVPYLYFITPNTAVPTSWILQMNGFDENLRTYGGEDTELGYRLHRSFRPSFIFNTRAIAETIQDKPLRVALKQLRRYGENGLTYMVRKHPEMKSVFWVYRCERRSIGDRVFEFLTARFFQEFLLFLSGTLPFFLQRHLFNYLVISVVHQGYRKGMKPTS